MNSVAPYKKEQLDYLYIVRALAILGVVLVHVSSIPIVEIADKNSSLFALFNFVNIFNKFGTPVFIFISALVLFYSYYDRPFDSKLVLRFYSRRFLYILLPYLLFSAFYYCIQTYYSYGENWRLFLEHATLSNFISKMIWGKAFYHLYFVFVSVQFYFVFPLLLRLLQRFPRLASHLAWFGIVLQCAFVVCNQYVLHVADKGQLAFSYCAFFLLGAYVGIRYERIKVRLSQFGSLRLQSLQFAVGGLWIMVAVADAGLWYSTRAHGTIAHPLAYEGWWFLHAYLSAIVLLQLSYFTYCKLHPVVVRLLLHLGAVSFGVYILHAAVLFYYSRYSHHFSYSTPVYAVYVAAGAAVTLLVPWGIVSFAQKYFRFSWILFGAMPKRKAAAHPSSLPKPRLIVEGDY